MAKARAAQPPRKKRNFWMNTWNASRYQGRTARSPKCLPGISLLCVSCTPITRGFIIASLTQSKWEYIPCPEVFIQISNLRWWSERASESRCDSVHDLCQCYLLLSYQKESANGTKKKWKLVARAEKKQLSLFRISILLKKKKNNPIQCLQVKFIRLIIFWESESETTLLVK